MMVGWRSAIGAEDGKGKQVRRGGRRPSCVEVTKSARFPDGDLSAQDTHSRNNAARGADVPMNVLIMMFLYVSSRILAAGSARTGCLSSLGLPFSQIMR